MDLKKEKCIKAIADGYLAKGWHYNEAEGAGQFSEIECVAYIVAAQCGGDPQTLRFEIIAAIMEACHRPLSLTDWYKVYPEVCEALKG